MRIAIMGSGATGTYYGAKLARAGYDVLFVARGAHLDALQTKGLSVVGQEEFHLPHVQATNAPAAVGPVDLILFCVKAYDTDEAARLIQPLVGPETVVLPIQNGVDNVERIGSLIGPEHLIGGLCRISVDIPQPGTVRLNSPFKEIIFGEMNGSPSARTAAIARMLERAEIPHKLSGDIRKEIWNKFTFITAMSGITGATRLPIGPIREVAEAYDLYGKIAAEVVAVGRAEGVDLDRHLPDELMAQGRALAAGLKASLLVDLERGRRTEVETLQGAVVRLGRKHGIPTPVTDVIYALLKVHQPR
ncbi:MAG TPA: ketopantoate reductase family protein [Symbiobacteriaceae bacterium]|nr:ketopantoate reductase family protein [Symbiobacteriaceae bacterium]